MRVHLRSFRAIRLKSDLESWSYASRTNLGDILQVDDKHLLVAIRDALLNLR